MAIRAKIKTPDPKKFAEKMKSFVTDDVLRDLETSVVSEIKKLIASGQSPTEGYGRFVQYKNRKKYPGKRKSATPVNLYLSGKMLEQYGVHKIDGKTIGIGYDPKSTSEKMKGQVRGNNIGTERGDKGIPTRRFIPQPGESFTISVIRKLKDIYANRIKKLFY